METINDVPLKKISWNKSGGGTIRHYYLPDNKLQLYNLCKRLWDEGKDFDVIGHTSNILFSESYSPDTLISTRRANHFEIKEDVIICEAGVSVQKLARIMVEEGVKGFEGLVDLPGTIASAIYGNAGCYDCTVSDLCVEVELMTKDKGVICVSHDDLGFQKRSSALKRKELSGVILAVHLRKTYGDKETLSRKAQENRANRKETQPGPAKNLGSVFGHTGSKTIYYYVYALLCRIHSKLNLTQNDKRKKSYAARKFAMRVMGCGDIAPYVEWNLNRYIWNDEKAHQLFQKYCRFYQKLYRGSILEIEIFT